MRLHRRGFLGALATAAVGAAAAALEFDPGRALWVPGQKRIFVPPSGGWAPSPQSDDHWDAVRHLLRPGDIFTIEGWYVRNDLGRLQQFVVQEVVSGDTWRVTEMT